MIFLLYSDYFVGHVDATRDNITLPNIEQVKKVFKDKVAEIIDEKLPQIKQRNNERKAKLINQFPHLNGYFEIENIGYASQNDLLKKAQDQFFREQREILGASHLDDEKLKKSLELSSRELTAYIMFRQNLIEKLKTIDKKDRESVIHNLIAPRYEQFDAENLINDLYRNNVWVLDDKYMTYDTILSEKEMTDVINVITNGEVNEKDTGRPDIAMIFSGNPNDKNIDKKVDVVIIELKQKGLSEENNSIVEIQLEKRARKLLQYYKNKIQQIWFYGIVEFNEDYELHLQSNEYHKLYSNGKVYFRNKDVPLELNSTEKFPMNLCILDFDALVFDANARNSTFLSIIKSKF
jgi:phage gp36-like protein